MRLRRAVADAGSRSGQLHGAKDRCARQHHLPVAAQRAARRTPRRDQRRLPNRELPDDARTVPGGDGCAAAPWSGAAKRRPARAGRYLRRSHQRDGFASSQGAAVRWQASESRPGPLQLVQREPWYDLRVGVRSGDQRRALDAADGSPEPAGGAAQRPVRLLTGARETSPPRSKRSADAWHAMTGDEALERYAAWNVTLSGGGHETHRV